MNEIDKITIVQDLNIRLGGDVHELENALQIENDLVTKREKLQSSLNVANNEVPTRLSSAINKAEKNSKQIETLKLRSEGLKSKVDDFLNRTERIRNELNMRFSAMHKLDEVLVYLKTFEKVEDISRQLKQCSDDEQIVQLYGELKQLCIQHCEGHRGNYLKDYTHYWHNILKDKFTKQYEDVLKALKWPVTVGVEKTIPSKEVLAKFSNLTRYLFLVEEPEEIFDNISADFSPEYNPCLPVRVLLRPLKKRFAFHFSGSRQTARIDRPEWFLTQTLTWIKDHHEFVMKNVQPVADKLDLKNVRAVEEFNSGIISLAAERLHTVLGLYHTQGIKNDTLDVDAAFAHAVDETLGFHKELEAITSDVNGVLSVLTKAETFVRWLSVEKKYALSKMDEMLSNNQWHEAVGSGVSGVSGGGVLWVPRAGDWFISLLQTIQQRYSALEQPGHRLQFLELQLDLIEEWRVRLTQLLSAAVTSLNMSSFTDEPPPHLTAVINAAHYTRTVLGQWAHSLHYLQLYYYRRQFQHFTQLQHREDDTESVVVSERSVDRDDERPQSRESDRDDNLSLKEVETRAKKLALKVASRANSLSADQSLQKDITIPNLTSTEILPSEMSFAEDGGVFGDFPALLAHLRDAGLNALAEHISMEFKAGLKEYKKQKWHAMLVFEENAVTVSTSLCRPLCALCSRLSSSVEKLAPPLATKLRRQTALHLDTYIFEEVVLESWFNTGGTVQFTHDVKRNLVPAFAPPNKVAKQYNPLPKLMEACAVLNLDYDDARRLRTALNKQHSTAKDMLSNHKIVHITPAECLQILNQRTDITDSSSPASVLELF